MARVTLACKVVLAGLGLNLTNMERHVGIGMAGMGHVASCGWGMVPCHVGIGMAGMGHVARCGWGMVPCHVGIGMAGMGDVLAGMWLGDGGVWLGLKGTSRR